VKDGFLASHPATLTLAAARSYALCLRELQLPASQCVFVDDQMRNIEGAQAVGMPAVWFDVRHPQTACDQAAHLLGLAAAQA